VKQEKADQRLKHQIIDLERHLQNLEINNFEEQYDGEFTGRRHPKQLQNARLAKLLQYCELTISGSRATCRLSFPANGGSKYIF
jgi:hypothetical protein